MAPFLPVYVHDSYVAGEGVLSAKVIGLFSVADLRGTREAARGELMCFLAEAAWYPTALLPSQGVVWTAVDRVSANAILEDGTTTVTLSFRFSEAGLIESVFVPDRGRVVKGAVIRTAWQRRFRNYERRHGMLVPMDAEVAWLLPTALNRIGEGISPVLNTNPHAEPHHCRFVRRLRRSKFDFGQTGSRSERASCSRECKLAVVPTFSKVFRCLTSVARWLH